MSGGPYGVEDAVSSFGPGLALLLLVLTPFLWSLPVSLAMAELAAAMPDEGGYVTWVRRAFGPYWGFQVGWWSWIDSFVDVAVYPALFVEYVKFWYPTMTSLERWLLAVLFIVVLTMLNVLGVRPTGRAAVVLAVLALLPVALVVGVGLAAATQAPWRPFVAEGRTVGASLGLGLAVVMWNYSGWDTPSTCLGETKAPEHAFRRALFLALPVIAVAYVLPVAALLATGATDWSTWDTGALPRLAGEAGGAWLGHAVAAGAVVSATGLFLTLLLTNSRLPYVLARDGLMPTPAGRDPSALRHPVGGDRPLGRDLRRLRRVLVQGADRPQRVALLAEPAGGAGRLRVASRSRAGTGAPLAGAGRDDDGAGGGRGAGGAIASGDGDGRVAQHAGGGGRRPDRTRRLRVGASGASRFSSMTCVRQESVASV